MSSRRGRGTATIGAMRHLVSIEQPTRSRTATGGFTSTWAAITGGSGIYGELRPLNAFEVERYGHTVGKVSHRLRVRVEAISAVTSKMRVSYGGRVFAIVGTMNPDERGRFFDIMLAETVSGGPTTGEGD